MDTRAGLEPTLPVHFQLIDIWQRILGGNVESITDDFFDLGGHSLLVARLLDEIETETGRRLEVATFLREPTIAGCTAALLSEPQPVRPIVCLQRGDGAVPLIFFHGDILGGGFYVRRLAPLFGQGQPLYVIAPTQLAPDRPLPGLEDIAALRVQQIQNEIPRGPYALAGFCIGGVVAFEVARQLAARGEQVKALVMIDPEIGGRGEALCLRAVNWVAERRRWSAGQQLDCFIVARRKLGRLRQMWNSSWREKWEFVLRGLSKASQGDARGLEGPRPAKDGRVLDAFEWMATAYRPKQYDGRVKLLYTADQLEATPHLVGAWRRAAPQLRARRIPGRHLTAITTYGASIVASIRAELRVLNLALLSLWDLLPTL